MITVRYSSETLHFFTNLTLSASVRKVPSSEIFERHRLRLKCHDVFLTKCKSETLCVCFSKGEFSLAGSVNVSREFVVIYIHACMYVGLRVAVVS